MKFAPIGIGAAMAVTVGHSGIGVLANLGTLVVTLYGALVVFVVVVLLPWRCFARIPSRGVLALRSRSPALIAFSTASSEAALPLAMEHMTSSACPAGSSRSSCPRATPSTSTARPSTSAVASIFVAQAAGVHIRLGQQLLMMLTLMLTSKASRRCRGLRW